MSLPEPSSLNPEQLESRHPANQFGLISPEELISLQGDCLLLEAHFSSVDHPLSPDAPPFRHLPGAIQVHPSYLEAGLNREKYYPHYDHPEEANILKGHALALALERLGITPDSQVVVYGSDPDGVMAAARLVWGLMYAGVKSVRFLDGGIDAWLEHGQETVMTTTSVWDLPDITFPRHEWSFVHRFLASTPEVQRHLLMETACDIGKLIDVRTVGEWNGTTPKKYPFFSRAGHIPRAIHQGDWGNLMEGRSKRLLPHLETVRDRWNQLGIVDSSVDERTTPLTFYCGTGWRSSIAFLVAHMLGYEARNYEEGFFGWSHDPRNHVLCRNAETVS